MPENLPSETPSEQRAETPAQTEGGSYNPYLSAEEARSIASAFREAARPDPYIQFYQYNQLINVETRTLQQLREQYPSTNSSDYVAPARFIPTGLNSYVDTWRVGGYSPAGVAQSAPLPELTFREKIRQKLRLKWLNIKWHWDTFWDCISDAIDGVVEEWKKAYGPKEVKCYHCGEDADMICDGCGQAICGLEVRFFCREDVQNTDYCWMCWVEAE